VVIGYFSASTPIRADFGESSGILDFMERHPKFAFGSSAISFSAGHGGYRRVERIGFLERRILLRRIAETDINLAPLEPESVLRGKSELKFFEAGCRRPTVASARKPSRAASRWISGFLARDTAECVVDRNC